MIPVLPGELNIAADQMEKFALHDPYLVLLLRAGAAAMARVTDLETALQQSRASFVELSHRFNMMSNAYEGLKADAEWRRTQHDRLGRGKIETEGKFYDRLDRRFTDEGVGP